jgi:hypothetical protein
MRMVKTFGFRSTWTRMEPPSGPAMLRQGAFTDLTLRPVLNWLDPLRPEESFRAFAS